MGIVVVVTILNFCFIIPTFVLAIIFYKLRCWYVSTSRSIKRLEGISKCIRVIKYIVYVLSLYDVDD